MTNPTSNYGWQMPTPVDLVTDLPADFEVFGQAVDTALADLKGGTTGQILSKTTNTDMDFTWIANDQGDITGITAGTGITVTSPTGPVPTVSINTAVTADLTTAQTLTNKTLTSPVLTTPSISNINAKGDVLIGSADNTLAIISVGNNGESLLADSTATNGIRYQGSITAGKNFIINGGFDVWQRGTSFSVSAFNFPYTADRWTTFNGAACTISQETSTVPTGANYALKVTGGATTAAYEVFQGIESLNAIRLANKAVVATILATGTSAITHSLTIEYSTSVDPNAATGTWTGVGTAGTATVTSGTFSTIKATATIPSTAKSIRIKVTTGSLTSGQTAIFGNAQLELGTVGTEFSRAGATIAGELALCQRYYFRNSGAATNDMILGFCGVSGTTTAPVYIFQPPVTMRVAPTAIDSANLQAIDQATGYALTSLTLGAGNQANVIRLVGVVSACVAFRPLAINASANNAFLGLSAEL